MIVDYREYESLLEEIEALLPQLPWEKRACALLLLQGDDDLLLYLREEMERKEYEGLLEILKIVQEGEVRSKIFQVRSLWALDLAERVTIDFKRRRGESLHLVDRIMTSPLTGFPIMLVILYLGLYYFVGGLGAGRLVDLLEGRLFGEVLIPFLTTIFLDYLPWPILQDLFIGPYGLLSLGLRYAIGIILPIVGSFFLFFSLLEDTGYLPRIGVLLDRIFKVFGLGGQSVIPVLIGFGCATMGTLTTRILKSERERIIATFLLSLAIPCSAQLGLIFGLLSHDPLSLLIWGGVIFSLFLVSGRLLTLLLPGRPSSFLVEVPLLRLPSLSNSLRKTMARIRWYLLEIIPLFLYISLFIWVLRLMGIFESLLRPLEVVVTSIGLPEEMAQAFFFGFFRRDYGAALIYDLYQEGLLTGPSLVVAAVTMTLFVPCMAQMVVNVKERGWRVALAMVFTIIPLAFSIGYLLNRVLSLGLFY